MSDPKIERIKSIPFFAKADSKAIKTLASAADEVDVKAGRTIIGEGEFNLVAYIVESGEAEVVVREEAVATIGAGEMLSLIHISEPTRPY